ncbi:MAG: hypothetical protein ACK55S_07770, partial [Planctomycetota bacterium]
VLSGHNPRVLSLDAAEAGTVPSRHGPLREASARPFEATPYDRILLAKTSMEWLDQDFGGLKLRVFADDFTLAGPSD